MALSSDTSQFISYPGQVGIILGSDSDLPVMKQAGNILEELDVTYELTIVSAHRTPERMMSYAEQAIDRGIRVIIAGAGGAAHLPGMVASMTTLPVIGVPIGATSLKGEDALLSIVQMPAGVPVATVAIDNAVNAGLLAARILAISDQELRGRLLDYRSRLRERVLARASAVESAK